MRLNRRQDRECPYCKLTWSAGLVVVEPGDGLPPEMQGASVVTHEEPRCEEFEKMDSADFVRLANTGVLPKDTRN